jgi:hypothetical protein
MQILPITNDMVQVVHKVTFFAMKALEFLTALV